MARTTFVKSAQQRYETKPVLDENGQPKRVPVLRKDGQPKMTSTKGGKRTARPITMAVTERDLTRPKPLLSCDFPGCQINGGKIAIGTSYRWIKPKSGPYGGRQRNRHAEHPTWNVWDYSNSLSAKVAQIEHDALADSHTWESEDDASAEATAAAERIRELADEKRESAQNIEDGFGHATSQSEELEQQADDLDGWADDVEQTTFSDIEDCDNCQGAERVECDECDGSGCDDCEDGTVECPECDGTGHDLATARDIWAEELSAELGNCPV